jgi:hypothetical protein
MDMRRTLCALALMPGLAAAAAAQDVAVSASATQTQPSARFDARAATDEAFLDHVARATYRWLERHSHPESGFVLDRSRYADLSSIAATGFGLAAHAAAAERGWISREEGADRCRRILKALSAIPAEHVAKGIPYHFVDARTGLRKGDSELSVVDAALLSAGAVVARASFPQDPVIASLSTSLIERADWAQFFDAGRGLFFLSWMPKRAPGYAYPDPAGAGFFCGGPDSPVHWGVYTDELLLMAVLAAASSSHAVPISCLATMAGPAQDYDGLPVSSSYNGSLFTYFLGACFLDPRPMGPTVHGFAWFDNSRRAIEANRRFAAKKGLPAWAFGITACDGPDGGYHDYGAEPSVVPPKYDGTVATYGILGSLLHAPKPAIEASRRLWELGYFNEQDGFVDAVNLSRPDHPWVNPDRLGINQGTTLLVLENHRTGFVARRFSADPAITRVLCDLFPSWRP